MGDGDKIVIWRPGRGTVRRQQEQPIIATGAEAQAFKALAEKMK